MKRHLFCGVAVVGGMLAYAPAVLAQTEWSSVAKITSGRCGEGAIAQIVERAGTMNIKTFVNGQQSVDLTVALAPDGSGKAQASGQMGLIVFEIPPGQGKRPMKNSQLDGGRCQWVWTPK